MESQGSQLRRTREEEIQEKQSQLDKLNEDKEAKSIGKCV